MSNEHDNTGKEDEIRISKDFVIAFKSNDQMEAIQLESGTSDNEEEDDGLNIINTVLENKYRIIKRLGGGGMGSVYLAEHKVLGKKVAIKVLRPEFARRKKIVARFLTEAKATSRIKHENIIDVSDFGETSNHIVYIVMEYLEGIELAAFLDMRHAMPWNEAYPIILQICRGLRAAHRNNIIHRDIKPSNIFLIKFGDIKNFVKIIDFGIAKINDVTDQKTKTGVIMGTPDYMSPEQAMGEKPTFQSDIYSVGVMLYEMLTDSLPFEADSFMGLLTKHMHEDPEPPSKRAPHMQITPEVESIVLKAMAKKAEDRFQSMDEMISAIEKINPEGKGEKVKVPISAIKRKKRNNLITGAVLLALTAVFVFVVFFIKNNKESDEMIVENNEVKTQKIPEKTKTPGDSEKHKTANVNVKSNVKQKIHTLNLSVNVKSASVIIEKGQLQIQKIDGSFVTLKKGDSLGLLPLKDLKIKESSGKVTLKIKSEGYKDLLLEIIPKENLKIEKLMEKKVQKRKKHKKHNSSKKHKKHNSSGDSELIVPSF